MGTVFLSLGIGLLLGAALAWLYHKATSSKKVVSITDFESLKAQIQIKETELAVCRDRESNILKELSESKESIAALQETNSKYLADLSTVKSEKESTTTRASELKSENDTFKEKIGQITDDLNTARNTIVKLQEEVKSKDEKLATQKRDFDEIKQSLEKEFKLVANALLADNAKTFTEQQTSKLEDLLKPFREQIDGFKKDVDAKFTQEATEKGSLKQQIESLVQLNQSISKEALALTEALRGSTKKQGDWGEDILERILEYSGLQKDVHYKLQHHATNEEGKTIRPDVFVYYPDKRYLVIDAKVSLSNYWDYCNAATIEEQNACIPKVVMSVKTHIDGLANKRYTDIPGTPEFIIMFMPVEAAYITAMQHDYTLWQYAYDKKIILISPTNLIPAMKMVSIMWDKDTINRDSETIVAKAVKLYEKFQGFINTFESVGSEIDQAQKKWQEARGQLYKGRDNFIGQGDKLKKMLGKRTTKELPIELVSFAELEPESESAVGEDIENATTNDTV